MGCSFPSSQNIPAADESVQQVGPGKAGSQSNGTNAGERSIDCWICQIRKGATKKSLQLEYAD